jgi:hypothetical protein
MGEQSPNGSAEPDWLRALRSSAQLRAQWYHTDVASDR